MIYLEFYLLTLFYSLHPLYINRVLHLARKKMQTKFKFIEIVKFCYNLITIFKKIKIRFKTMIVTIK